MPTPRKEDLEAIFEKSRMSLTLEPHSPKSTRYGDWDSDYLGEGFDFEEFREFRPGDNPRRIHAVMSSRMGKDMVIRYREPREARLLIVLDITPSMFLRDKFRMAYAAMSMVFISASDIHMPVALWAVANDYELEATFPFTNEHMYFFEDIVSGKVEASDSYFCVERSGELSLDNWREALPGGSFVFVVSDFLGKKDNFQTLLDDELGDYYVIPVVVQDDQEYTFPEINSRGVSITFGDAEGLESETLWVDKKTSADVRDTHEKRFTDLRELFREKYLSYAHLKVFDLKNINSSIEDALQGAYPPA
ncbi:MAG: DUF58 domain-containing protein [Candidatus Spechtbacterales bacterium]